MSTLAPTLNFGYLRSPSFDIFFIAAIPIIAIFASYLPHINSDFFIQFSI
ncbi:hypothetical protein MNBD_GAMMA08-2411 [hydrothermal vent metagenome]|uniref:Uncharacterized protein n=1 Tax=hydrothermal vent metagenome TaxID=652676 RepID=A0A3B0X2V4_9ZZZZ